MSDELLPYYNRELEVLRRTAQDFAAAHPRIAGHLRLSGDAMDDPHVLRLMQGVAFLNARTARKLDDEFPELVDTLLELLYPHYLAPIPSLSVVRFRPAAEMTGPHLIPSGSLLETELVEGEACRFRTCYPVTLWPIALTEAALLGQPLAAPANPEAEGAAAALSLTLRCLPDGMTFSELQPDRLRFYLRGPASQVYALHQMILNDTVSVALADSAADPNPVIVPPGAVSAVGFAPDEGLLPYPARSQGAYPHATLTAARRDGDVLNLTVSGFGLLGPVGTLPYSYTALVADSVHANSPGLKAFLDIFQHRAVALFYGAASKYRIVINYDRKLRGAPDRYGEALAHLTGLGLPSLRGRLQVPDETILHFAGLFASKARTVAGLETILADALDAPVRVVPLIGRWLSLAEDDQTRIGDVRGRHGVLGSSAVAGTRTWSVQSNFRIVVGPVGAERVDALLPGGTDAATVADLVGLYGGLEYAVDLNLVIRAAAVPRARLAPAGETAGAVRLGLTTWLLAAPSPVDRDEAVFALDPF